MLPFETILAIFPPSAADDAGRELGFRPVSIAHVVAMEAFGIDLDRDIDHEHALTAAWILTQDGASLARIVDNLSPAGFEEWARGCRFSPREIENAVNGAFAVAMATVIEAKKPDGTKKAFEETGLGWALELAEWYASEYKVSFEKALVEPLVRIFACVACARQRRGEKHGSPDYYEKHRAKGMAEQLRALQEAGRV